MPLFAFLSSTTSIPSSPATGVISVPAFIQLDSNRFLVVSVTRRSRKQSLKAVLQVSGSFWADLLAWLPHVLKALYFSLQLYMHCCELNLS